MKKEFRLLAWLFTTMILLILFVNLVIAQTNIQEGLKNSGEVSIREKTNEVLEKEVQIPENLQLVARVLFGLEEGEKVSFQLFVILIAAWIFLFLFLHIFVEIMPFFEGWKSWLGSLLIMLLIGISGGLQLAAQFLMDVSKLFGILEGWLLLTLGISLIILVAIIFLGAKLARKLKSTLRIEENRIVGQNVGFAGKIGEIQRKAMEEKD